MAILKEHPMLGLTIEYPRKSGAVRGIVTAVREARRFVLDSDGMTVKTWDLLELKIQPDTGAKAFWTAPIYWDGKLPQTA